MRTVCCVASMVSHFDAVIVSLLLYGVQLLVRLLHTSCIFTLSFSQNGGGGCFACVLGECRRSQASAFHGWSSALQPSALGSLNRVRVRIVGGPVRLPSPAATTASNNIFPSHTAAGVTCKKLRFSEHRKECTDTLGVYFFCV
jgi:hypothetical protein